MNAKRLAARLRATAARINELGVVDHDAMGTIDAGAESAAVLEVVAALEGSDPAPELPPLSLNLAEMQPTPNSAKANEAMRNAPTRPEKIDDLPAYFEAVEDFVAAARSAVKNLAENNDMWSLALARILDDPEVQGNPRFQAVRQIVGLHMVRA